MLFELQERQYQVLARPVFFGETTIAGVKWFEPFSEPVRFRLDKRLAIALIASGLTYAPQATFNEIVTESRWHQPFSEPIRAKPGLHSSLQQFYMAEPFGMVGHETNIEAKWHFTWSEPIWLSFKRSISIANQKAWFGPDRLLPTPQVIITMLAIESEDDIALASVNVYNPQPVAVIGVQTRVSISEVVVPMSPTAITESQ